MLYKLTNGAWVNPTKVVAVESRREYRDTPPRVILVVGGKGSSNGHLITIPCADDDSAVRMADDIGEKMNRLTATSITIPGKEEA